MYTKKLHFYAKNHLQTSDLRYDQYLSRRGRNRTKNRCFSYVFVHDATGICRIANRTTGGGSSRRRASFLYTSHLRGIKIHILNCGRSLKKFGGVCQETAANRRGSNRGQHYAGVNFLLGMAAIFFFDFSNDSPWHRIDLIPTFEASVTKYRL